MATTSTNMASTQKDLDLRVKRVFGLSGSVKGNCAYVDELTLGYVSGSSLVLHDLRDNAQKLTSNVNPRSTAMFLTLSRNRRLLAISYHNGPISVFDSRTGSKVASLSSEVPIHETVSMDFSKDAKVLVVLGGAPNWMLVHWRWEADRGVSWAPVHVKGPIVHQASVHPDDDMLMCVTGAQGLFRHLRLLDGSFKLSAKPKNDDKSTSYLCHAWVSDTRVLAGTDLGTVVLFDGTDIRQTWELPTHGQVTYVVPFDNGFSCIQGSLSIVHVFQRVGGARDYEFVRTSLLPKDDRSHERAITGVSISPSGKSLAVVASDLRVYSMDLSSDKDHSFRVALSGAHTSPIHQMDLSVRRPIVVTCSTDNLVCVFNYVTGDQVIRKRYSEDVLSVSVHPLGFYVALGFPTKLVIASVSMDDLRPIVHLPIDQCNVCAFSNGGHLLAAAQLTVIHVYCTVTYRKKITVDRAHRDRINNVRWTSDDRCLVTCGSDCALYHWDPSTGQKTKETVFNNSKLLDVTIYEDDVAIVLGDDNALREVDRTGHVKRIIELPNSTLTTLTNLTSAYVAVATSCGRIHVIALREDGRNGKYGDAGPSIVQAIVDWKWRYMVTGCSDGSVRVLEICDGAGFPLTQDPEATLQFNDRDEVLTSKMECDERAIKMAELEHRVREMTLEREFRERIDNADHDRAVEKVLRACDERVTSLNSIIQGLHDEIGHLVERHEKTLEEARTGFEREMERARADSHQKLLLEYEKYRQLQLELCDNRNKVENLLRKAEDDRLAAIDRAREETALKMSILRQNLTQAEALLAEERTTHDRDFIALQTQKDEEIQRMRDELRIGNSAESEEKKRLNASVAVLSRKLTVVKSEERNARSESHAFSDELRKSEHLVERLRKDCKAFVQEIGDRDRLLQCKEKCLDELRCEVRETKKLNSLTVLRMERCEEEMKAMNDTLRNFKSAYDTCKDRADALSEQIVRKDIQVGGLRSRLTISNGLLGSEKRTCESWRKAMNGLRDEIINCCKVVQDNRLLRSKLFFICNCDRYLV